MTQSLSDIFREKRQQAQAANQGVDWNQRRDDWIARINDLYQSFRGYLAEPIAQQLITLSTRAKTITEEHIGTYEVAELILRVGDEQVTFSPTGRNLIGAQGRIDVLGEAGEAMFVAQPDRWSIVKSRTPTLRVVSLDAQTFAETLVAVMRS